MISSSDTEQPEWDPATHWEHIITIAFFLKSKSSAEKFKFSNLNIDLGKAALKPFLSQERLTEPN